MPEPQPVVTDFIAELEWRGLLKDCTDTDGLRAHLATPGRKAYAGFDPTADSLTIGNLVPIMCLAHFKRSGHHPVVLMGGGTGLIGDPSGKSAERQLNTPETVAANIAKQRPIFDAVLSKIPGPDYEIMNNADWLTTISYIEALRDIGKHFSVNMMMQKESVKERLTNREQGISYTEFSYMILQAYDFAHLYEKDGVTVQLGGSDQYGNIVAGTDLIRRMFIEPKAAKQDQLAAQFYHEARKHQPRVAQVSTFTHMAIEAEKKAEEIRKVEGSFGLTAPLVQKADGGKFGKTETGAVWLTAERTSPYAYYQFWLNASDDDVRNFLRTFTFLTREEIESIESSHIENPGLREAQRRLAQEATKILHGEEAMLQAEAAGKALFSGDISGLDLPTLNEVFASVPSSDHAKSELAGEGGGGMDPLALLTAIGAAKSNREGREFLANGSVSVNGEKIGPDDRLTESHLLHGSLIAIRRGKKNWYLTRWK